jgi:hypothetical protein
MVAEGTVTVGPWGQSLSFPGIVLGYPLVPSSKYVKIIAYNYLLSKQFDLKTVV